MNLLKPKTVVTPTPAQAQFETQIDNVAGTKVERVKQPDGSYATVRSALPLSVEDQAYQDTLKSIAQNSLDYITKLSTDYDPNSIPWLKQYLADYEATQNDVIDKAGLARTTSEEKALARYGQADSTAAVQARDARGEDLISSKIQLGRDMSTISQQARDSELSKQGSLYSLATGGLNNQTNTQMGSLAGLVNTGLNQQGANQNYNNSVAAVAGQNSAAAAAAKQQYYDNIVGIASLASGGAGGAGGGSAKAGTTGGWANYGNGNYVNWNSGRMY
ncbi:hypothetical protein GFL93_09405 [Rhizobium leguminosarum bv. viciae]|uniref:hypothetical protein n=1 Tax=Rhizobium TaxID=379 RepID=UPI0014418D06|nr:hypothetical protein [Rhizobium leguminosarum]NKK06087.1 hypothetical protein [Rhizobium leguminosarum bv. viciae]